MFTILKQLDFKTGLDRGGELDIMTFRRFNKTKNKNIKINI